MGLNITDWVLQMFSGSELHKEKMLLTYGQIHPAPICLQMIYGFLFSTIQN